MKIALLDILGDSIEQFNQNEFGQKRQEDNNFLKDNHNRNEMNELRIGLTWTVKKFITN